MHYLRYDYFMGFRYFFFFRRTIFTFPAFIERAQKRTRRWMCFGIMANNMQMVYYLSSTVGLVRKVWYFLSSFFLCQRYFDIFSSILTQIYVYMLYMRIFLCVDKNRTVWFVQSAEKKRTDTGKIERWGAAEREKEKFENMNRTCKFMYIFAQRTQFDTAKLKYRMKYVMFAILFSIILSYFVGLSEATICVLTALFFVLL